jgi:hypothetical protein
LIIGGDIFATRSGPARDRKYKRRSYPVAEKESEVVSSRLVLAFCLPYDDYKVYRR